MEGSTTRPGVMYWLCILAFGMAVSQGAALALRAVGVPHPLAGLISLCCWVAGSWSAHDELRG